MNGPAFLVGMLIGCLLVFAAQFARELWLDRPRSGPSVRVRLSTTGEDEVRAALRRVAEQAKGAQS